MDYKYLKSNFKTKKLLGKVSIIHSFTFLKVITRCIILNYTLIYWDESSLQNNNNNNYYFWRQQKEDIYDNLGQKKIKYNNDNN